MGEPDKPLTQFDEIRENPADLSEKEWRQRLTPDQFYVCRQRGTEPAYVGRYVKFDKKGTYHCMACDAFLFKSEHKYPSNCGWPAFFAARPGDVKQRAGGAGDTTDGGQETVKRREDNTLGMTRVEVSCRLCNSHLGHVFPDGPLPTKERFCINSMAINFRKSQPPTSSSSCSWKSSRLTSSPARQRTQSPATPRDSNNTAAGTTTTSVGGGGGGSSSSSSSKSTSTSASNSRSSSASRSRDSSAHRSRDGSAHRSREGSARQTSTTVQAVPMSACCGPLSVAAMKCPSAIATRATATAAATAAIRPQDVSSSGPTKKRADSSQPAKQHQQCKKTVEDETPAASTANRRSCQASVSKRADSGEQPALTESSI